MRPTHKHLRTLIAALTATILLAAATNAATARSLSISNQNVRGTWSSLEFNGGSVIFRCRVTLEGSFHTRTVAKVARSLVGAVTRATVDEANCTNGNGRPRNETLPWHITYEGFTGTLPNISGVFLLLSRFRFTLTVPGLCTADYGTATDNITGRVNLSGGEITSLEPVAGRNRATLHSGGAFCPGSGTFGGSGTVTLLGTTTRIRVTLI